MALRYARCFNEDSKDSECSDVVVIERVARSEDNVFVAKGRVGIADDLSDDAAVTECYAHSENERN